MEPAVDLQEIYNSNIRLTNTAHDSVTGTILSPRLNFAARMETWQLGAETRFRDSRYHGIENLDTTDRIINLNSQYQTERNTLQLSGGKAKESILTGTFIDADTGLVKTQVNRASNNAAFSWTGALTEKDQLKLGYQYADVAYDQVSTANLYDYSQRGPSLTLSHLFSERAQVTLQVEDGRFTVPKLGTSHLGKDTRLETYPTPGDIYAPDLSTLGDPHILSSKSATNSFQVGVNYMLTDSVTGSLSVGGRKTTSDYLNESCESAVSLSYIPSVNPTSRYGLCTAVETHITTTTGRSTVYNASLTKKTETLQLTAGATRSIDPSGSGTQVQNDTINLTTQWSMTERLAFSLSGVHTKVRALENTFTTIDRQVYNIVPGMQWRAGSNSTVKLSYSYTHLSYVGIADPYSSKEVRLVYSYVWNKFSISR